MPRHLCEKCREEEYKTYAHELVHEGMSRNDKWLTEFRINEWPRWHYELDDGTLTFSKDGKPQVLATIEVAGTTSGDQWEWAWGNDTLPEQCRKRIGVIREFGEEKKWPRLTTLFLESDDFLGWELTSIAAHLLEGKGAYRCPAGDARPKDFLYVVIMDCKFLN